MFFSNIISLNKLFDRKDFFKGVYFINAVLIGLFGTCVTISLSDKYCQLNIWFRVVSSWIVVELRN